MQKVAGDIEAIEKISDVLLLKSLATFEPITESQKIDELMKDEEAMILCGGGEEKEES